MMGLFEEHGPCLMKEGETQMKPNPYSWNLRAHMVYIENPAGVGYSTGTAKGDLAHTDYSTSLDLMEALT